MRGQVSPHSHTWLPYITPNGVRLAHEILTNSYSYNQAQGFIGDTNFPMTNKKLHFFFALRSVCTNSRFAQVRLHLSNANKKISFFSLHCVRFALTLQLQKTKYSEKGLLCEYTCNVYNW